MRNDCTPLLARTGGDPSFSIVIFMFQKRPNHPTPVFVLLQTGISNQDRDSKRQEILCAQEFLSPRSPARRRMSKPPEPNTIALTQKTANKPNAEPSEPNSTGTITRVRLFMVTRNPMISPERPCMELLNASVMVIG